MTSEESTWVRRRFKKNKVWVAADKNGHPIVQNNKVLIKYQLDQDHEYRVHPEKISEIDSKPDLTYSQPKNKATHKNDTALSKSQKRVKPKQPHSDNKIAIESHKKGVIYIYTDGASSGNPGPAGAGVFLQYGDHQRKISKYIGESTNNIAELTAVKIALTELKRTDIPVRIYTDSSYVMGLLTSGWKAKKNISLINSIKSLMPRFKDLQFIKVKGHSGHPGNEQADQLATEAIKSQSDFEE